ncbi:MAG: RDD family protein [Chloroflexota bacterium]
MVDEQEPLVAEYAGFWMRVAAYLIDAIAVWFMGACLVAVIGLIALPFGITEALLVPFHPVWYFYGGTSSFIWLVVPAAYFVLLWVLRGGQTPGMMALRIKVIRADGSPLDWAAAVVRFLGYIVCWLTLGVLFVWVAFDRRKQGLHDKMADTYVIMVPPARKTLREAEFSA